MGRQKRTPKNLVETLKQSVLQHMRFYAGKPFNYKQIASKLNIRDQESRLNILISLQELHEEGILEFDGSSKYILKERKNRITGIIDVTKNGAGYLLQPETGKDIYIPRTNLGRAFNGDEVEVKVTKNNQGRGRGSKTEGLVSKIIKRKRTTFPGIVDKQRDDFAFVKADNEKIHVDFFIGEDDLNGAEDGQKVLIRLERWEASDKNPIAKIVDILGYPGDTDAEIHAILAEYDLPYKFPQEVLDEANKLVEEISEEEIAKRRDFRGITTFTIDPVDAKDFDDALSVQYLENGNVEVGVHIADVSHYLQPGSVLDTEAVDRATSVYLVDRVVPMLPEVLSNQLCSLRPNEDKLCFSAVFELDGNANIKKQWLGRTVIHSDKRFAYEDAQEIIEGKEGELKEEIITLNELAKKLRIERVNHGAIEFGGSEVKFNLDENGKPTGVYIKETKAANKLIEEFMLLANKKVAEFVGKVKDNTKPKTFVYRVHDLPKEDKLKTLKNYLRTLDIKMEHISGKSAAFAINRMLKSIEGRPEEDLIKQLTIRTMAKAEYVVENIGHYGLAFDHYTHFTSPIRRYPDVLVHRLLQHYLDNGSSADQTTYEMLCKHSSTQEKKATDAERASIKYMQVLFMSERVGQEFRGIVSGVTSWGVYVELDDNRCEGMIPLNTLPDDYYHYDDSLHRIVGERTKVEFVLGTRVGIKVHEADLHKKQLDFRLMYVE